MLKNFIVVRNQQIVKVYQTTGDINGVNKALLNKGIKPSDVAIFEKLDDFQYSVGDMIYPYNPKDKRPENEDVVAVNPLFNGGLNV